MAWRSELFGDTAAPEPFTMVDAVVRVDNAVVYDAPVKDVDHAIGMVRKGSQVTMLDKGDKSAIVEVLVLSPILPIYEGQATAAAGRRYMERGGVTKIAAAPAKRSPSTWWLAVLAGLAYGVAKRRG